VRRRFPTRVSRRFRRRFLPDRALSAAVVLLLTFQMSRFFLVISLENFVCYPLNHSEDISLAGHHHHDHDGEAEALPHGDDGGNYFQHCKDTFDGIGLTPVQPLGLSVPVSDQPPELIGAHLLPESRGPLETDLPPPFQPPRNLR
jgi:hypothetical protein